MKSKLLKKLRRKRQETSITPGQTWEALQGWNGYPKEIHTGYTYIFKMSSLMRETERKELENRIRKALAAGVLVLDAGVELIEVKPRLETRTQIEVGVRNGD